MLFKRCGELVGATGGLVSATDSTQSCAHIGGFHATHQRANALCIAVTAANELHVLHHSLIINIDIDLT